MLNQQIKGENMEDMTLMNAVRRALQEEIIQITNAEAKLAAERVERAVKERTAQVCLRLLDHMSMERIGPELVIRVNFQKNA